MKWLFDFFRKLFAAKTPAETSAPTPLPKPPIVDKPVGIGVGPYTSAQVSACAKFFGVTELEVRNAPWMIFMFVNDGKSEAKNDRELADLLWKNTNYDEGIKAHTVTGRAFAWCKATVNTAFKTVGVSIAGHLSAAAVDARTFGIASDYRFGDLLPITHEDGSHHVNFFVKWLDRKNMVALCSGGNQGNKICTIPYNLSGNARGHDQVIPGPRRPKEFA